jgi:hypothetical protein
MGMLYIQKFRYEIQEKKKKLRCGIPAYTGHFEHCLNFCCVEATPIVFGELFHISAYVTSNRIRRRVQGMLPKVYMKLCSRVIRAQVQQKHFCKVRRISYNVFSMV